MRRWIPLLALVLTACGSGSSAPTSPTPPAAQTFTLGGAVTETAPTTTNKIPGATITFIDGSNAGKSATADGAGNYALAGLATGGFTVRTTAAGYNEKSQPVTINANTSLTVQLNPVPQTLSSTRNDTISGGDATCSDGIGSTRPCKTITLPIHNDGPISATLTWEPSSTDLDLTLWRGTALIASSRTASGRTETVSANATGGANFELHVTYYQGSVITTFQLRVTNPN